MAPDTYKTRRKQMSDTNLENLIAYSIRITTAEKALAKEKADADEATCRDLMQKATNKALLAVDNRDAIPDELVPYVRPTSMPDIWSKDAGIEALQEGWLPYEFIIEAPGLALIAFKIKTDYDRQSNPLPGRVHNLVAHNGIHGWETWHEAIAKAARMYADQVKWEEEEAQRSAEAIAAMKEPRALTLDERFVALIREIVRAEMANQEE